jgi:hypothetical protein
MLVATRRAGNRSPGIVIRFKEKDTFRTTTSAPTRRYQTTRRDLPQRSMGLPARIMTDYDNAKN